MNEGKKIRNKSIHLYNPKEEGWSSYDLNYTNALKKSRDINNKNETRKAKNARYAA